MPVCLSGLEALLVEAKAKADGEEVSIAAKNQADPKVLVSDAILALVESLCEVTGELMKPAERIERIRVLDLGNNGNGGNGMNRVLSSIVNAGAAVPLFKEIVGFSALTPIKSHVPFGITLPGWSWTYTRIQVIHLIPKHTLVMITKG